MTKIATAQKEASSPGLTGGPIWDPQRDINVDGPVKPDHDEVHYADGEPTRC